MKNLIKLFCVLALLWICACGGTYPGGLNGTWHGTLSADGVTAEIQIVLNEKADSVEGTFALLTETGQDVDKGMEFPIVRSERSGKELKFIVSISDGEVDEDALVFKMTIAGNTLSGEAYENKIGSEHFPITLTKQK